MVIDEDTKTPSVGSLCISKNHQIQALKNALSQLEEGRITPLLNVITPTIPIRPHLRTKMSIGRKLESIQKYISSFEYNHLGRETTFSFPRKDRGMKHLVNLAKVIIREALPIQCVEAVFLAVYLTNGMKELLRIPVSFRSSTDDEEHSHMILAIKYTKPRMRLTYASANDNVEAWGSLGISRLEKLMYKPLVYDSLAELVAEFAVSYQQYYHELHEVSFGLPFPHNVGSEKAHEWKALKIKSEESENKEHSESTGSYLTTLSVWTHAHMEIVTRFSKDCTKMCP